MKQKNRQTVDMRPENVFSGPYLYYHFFPWRYSFCKSAWHDPTELTEMKLYVSNNNIIAALSLQIATEVQPYKIPL
jgi:hypothetical protein